MKVIEVEKGVILDVKVNPRSSKNAISGFADGVLKIKITAPPVEGAANKACIRFLAKTFNISPSSVSVIKGEKSRQKKILIQGINRDGLLKMIPKGESKIV